MELQDKYKMPLSFQTFHQIRDTKRKWIKQEFESFTQELESTGAQFQQKLYFEKEAPSLENHFKCLKEFVIE